MGLIINLKERMELPEDWYELLQNSRKRPNLFTVIELGQNMIKKWTDFFILQYDKKCPFAIQPVKEITSSVEHVRLLSYRTTYNGCWLQSPIKKPSKTLISMQLVEKEFRLADVKYSGYIPKNQEKYLNLMKPKVYCENPDAAKFYTDLPHESKPSKKKYEEKSKSE